MKSEWREVTLGEIAEINMGQSPESQYYNFDEIGLPFLQGNRTFGAKYPTFDTYCNSPKKIAKKDEVLFSVRAPVGDINIATTDICIGRGLSSLSMKEGSNEFLFYLLHYLKNSILNVETGTIFGSVNRNELSKINVSLPPPLTQKKIAHILSTLDDKIELNRKMNQTLEAMAQALFKSWFVDFDPVHVKLTCKSEEELNIAAKKLGISKEILDLFPNEFEESELGMIPKGWSVKKLGECELEIESGTRPKGGIDKELSFGTPSVGAESIAPIGIFDFSNVKYVTNEFAAKAKRGWVQNMDVALYKDGGKPGIFMPRVGLYGNGYPFARFMINEHVFLLRSLLLGQYYLFQLVSSKSILDQLIARGSAKAAQPGLNQVEVSESKFVLPSKELLSAFNNIIGTFIAKQLENGKQIQTLQKTRDTLLPKLLSGELDVSELELDI